MKKAIMIGLIIGFLLSFDNSIAWAQEVDHSGFQDTEQCYQCHSEDVQQEKYKNSKHGNMPCISCHNFGSSGETQGSESPMEKCAGCHGDAASDYNLSVHKAAQDYGPSCADCHGSHYISSANGSGSPVNSVLLADTCGTCHAKVAESYKESFHGKAVVLGSKKSPDCTYCHGSHLILNSNNTESPTSAEKKPQLCAKCHQGETLGVGSVEHYTLQPKGFGAPMYWVKKVFMWLILLVVGFFLTHILLDLIYKLRKRKSRP